VVCPKVGAEIGHDTVTAQQITLKNIDHLTVRVARDHHERNNGSGYRSGMNLNDRAVEIVVICDIYDALSASRPYRPVSFDNRSAIEEITLMAERGDVSWEVVQALVAQNRKGKPHFSECSVSLGKRGAPPSGNMYGIIAENVSIRKV
jgi:HD-GYP domain-containing protein (c-di-GMP phosphodiesterase class II)